MKSTKPIPVVKFMLLILVVVFVLPFVTQISLAQELNEKSQDAIIDDDYRLRLSLDQLTQRPDSKHIPFLLTIKSKINSDRVRVSWKVRGQTTLERQDLTSGILRLRENEEYKLQINVVPVPYVPSNNEDVWRANEFSVLVEVNLIDGKIQSTARKNFAIFYDGTALPITDDYKRLKSEFETNQVIQGILFIIVILVVVLILVVIVIKWVQVDEVKLYEKTGKLSFVNKMRILLKNIVYKTRKRSSDEYEY